MTLIDTSVLIDAFDTSSPLNLWATDQIAAAVSIGGAAVNPITLAEVGVNGDLAAVKARITGEGIQLAPLPIAASGPAARAFAEYLPRRKAATAAPRVPLPDFFIGAHAEAEGWKLLTNDAARFRTYFPRVEVVAPEAD